MANVKLSQIASGGALVPATDVLVTVRNGNTDVLTTPGTAAAENLGTVIVDDGSGNLTIAAGQVTTARIANNAVTYAKIQQASASTLLGNPTGSMANVEEITLGSGLSFSGTTLVASGSGGGGGFTNTAVSNGSPYTASTGQNIYTIYNTSGASYTFNLNASPATNDVCVIIDAGLTAAAHPITVQGNGKTISSGGVSGSSYEIGSNGGAISLAWDGTQWSQYA